MDDIARDLGMSKKTLYQYFNNKADIVYAVSEAHFLEEKAACRQIMDAARDPIEEMVMILRMSAKSFTEISASMVYDIQRYYPKAWALFHDYKNTFVRDEIRENLRKGVEAGLYRKEMDIEVVAKLRVEEIEMVFNPELFPPHKYDFGKVQMELFGLFLHGLVTMKGKKLIYEYLNQPEDD